MKYRFTVWNTLIAMLFPVSTYILISQDAEPDTVFAAGYLIPILLIGTLIDFILQVAIKNRRALAVVEIISLVAIIIINNMR